MPQHDHHSNWFLEILDRFADIVQLIPIGIVLSTFMLAVLWCVIQLIVSPLFFNRWIVLSGFFGADRTSGV